MWMYPSPGLVDASKLTLSALFLLNASLIAECRTSLPTNQLHISPWRPIPLLLNSSAGEWSELLHSAKGKKDEPEILVFSEITQPALS
jgi:hypothetical protein